MRSHIDAFASIPNGRMWHVALITGALTMLLPTHAISQDRASMDVYGFAMTDMGFQFGQNDPNWYDVLRPTKLPAFEEQYGEDGRFFAGVRQSRLGVKASLPTDIGDLKTTFEFELFGTGVDAGQTTFRLRHAYGQIGDFIAGQTWSPFMDIDVFPNSIEYWGPNGMAFFRNVLVAWQPVQGESRVTVALERPGASGDQGLVADRIELDGIIPRFPYPDLSAEGRYGSGWGYVELAGIVRYMRWDDMLDDAFDLDGSDVGWGLNLSSNVKFSDHVLRLQALYGEGVQNYMNDAPVDVGVVFTGDPDTPIEGEALGVFGAVAFLDLNWSPEVTSTIGWSMLDMKNSGGQTDAAFNTGNYALVNVLFYPATNFLLGPELQWGMRENFRDGFESDDWRLQFSAKYNFSHHFGS